MGQTRESAAAYARAVFSSWWAVVFELTGGWGVIVFFRPQLASVMPPQITWGVALVCWVVAPFRAFHKLRLDAIRPPVDSAVTGPPIGNIALTVNGPTGPFTAQVRKDGPDFQFTFQPGVLPAPSILGADTPSGELQPPALPAAAPDSGAGVAHQEDAEEAGAVVPIELADVGEGGEIVLEEEPPPSP